MRPVTASGRAAYEERDPWNVLRSATSSSQDASRRALTSTPTWQRQTVVAQAGIFNAEVDVTPSSGAVDAGIGLASGTVSAWAKLASIVLFSPSGQILARNGGSYTAAVSMPYVANATYHVRLAVDVAAHTYSVFVTPAGGGEVQIAASYAFRTEQAAVSSLDGWALASEVGAIKACNMTVR